MFELEAPAKRKKNASEENEEHSELKIQIYKPKPS